jgi:hypothetical protein
VGLAPQGERSLDKHFCASRELDTPLDKTCFKVSLMRKNSLSRLRIIYGRISNVVWIEQSDPGFTHSRLDLNSLLVHHRPNLNPIDHFLQIGETMNKAVCIFERDFLTPIFQPMMETLFPGCSIQATLLAASVALISIFCASRELDTPLDKICFKVSLMRKNSLSRLRIIYGRISRSLD